MDGECMTVSMTGFAARRGAGAGFGWSWDIRSVNGKGLDLRLRVPDWVDGLELALRAELQKAMGRGNVSLSLKVTRETGDAQGLRLNEDVLAGVLAALARAEEVAMATGLTLGQPTAADVLAMRGVLESGAAEEDTAPLRTAILADLPALLAEFHAMRAAEGAALAQVIGAQLDRIEALVADARTQAEARRDRAGEVLRAALARVLDNADGVDETRLAQELALLAVKQDVTEETDRLVDGVNASNGEFTTSEAKKRLNQ